MKPLDIVQTPLGKWAIIKEVTEPGGRIAIEFFSGQNVNEKNAWWEPSSLLRKDSLPRILSEMIAHPFGNNRNQGDIFFGS